MHGQKRSEYKSRLLHPETATKLATKAQQWNHLSHELLTQRRRLFGPSSPPAGTNGIAADADVDVDASVVAKPSPEILLTLTEKMLSVNPDPSHLWNIRREMLFYVPVGPTSANDDDVAVAGNLDNSNTPPKNSAFEVQTELTLTAHCLMRNPKSYSAWYHRKWALVYYLTHPTDGNVVGGPSSAEEGPDAPKVHLNSMGAILQSELDLCVQFLQLDERNFHCWNYRRFVVAILGSCGSTTSACTAVQHADMAVKSDLDLFNGTWSSWLNYSQGMMGAQLSQSAGSAVGIIPIHPKQDDDMDGTTASCVAKHVTPLSEQELAEIIRNEWDFTTSKIQDNFSNGSAFHYRSKLLPLVLESRLSSTSDDGGGGSSDGNPPSASERCDAIQTLAREEWENILLNAIFTEPDDQTPWWYHRFVVSWAKPSHGLDDEYESLLFEMADSLRDLLEVEKENDMVGNEEKKDESKGAKCKWAYIGLHLVLSTLLESDFMDEEESAEVKEEVGECLAELMKIDLNRRERYQNLAAEMAGNGA
mmetsp:Transcript_7336/g.13680  ORF Transcript_7336/g.13680 Transcript_7336/m.13680 type:complete len:533 (-) Transcript_7336:100-1698(-)